MTRSSLQAGLALLGVCAFLLAGCGSRGEPPSTSANTALPALDAAALAGAVEVVSFAADPADNSWAILELKVKQGWTARQLVLQIGEGGGIIPIASEAASGDTIQRPLEYFLFKSAPSVRLAWRELPPG
ncbi:MAG: hypothetical protein V2A58_01965 [Planctomycetota bacterium]